MCTVDVQTLQPAEDKRIDLSPSRGTWEYQAQRDSLELGSINMIAAHEKEPLPKAETETKTEKVDDEKTILEFEA